MRKLVFIIATLLILSNAAFCQQLQIHHIDVGQGDCTLIISPDNKTAVLIDAGDNGCGNRFVRPYLNKIGVSQLKYVFASHYDADHIGGLDEILMSNDFTKIGTVYDRGDKPIPKATYTMLSYKTAAKEHRKTLRLGQVINIGGGASIKCIAKNGVVLGKKAIPNAARNENNLSVVLLLTYKNFRYYTGGDIGGENTGVYVDIETPISTVIGSVDAIKVDHHGSASSSNTTFLNVLNPTVAIIDVGTSKYHHPTQNALNRLFEAKSIIYQTQPGNGGTLSTTGSDYIANGSIKITTDGEKQFNVYYRDENPNHYSIR